MTKNSPFGIVSDTSRTATKSPNFLCRLWTRISAIAVYSGKWLTIT